MCVEVITRWPCGHTRTTYEFCDKAKPKKRIIVFKLRKPKTKPLAPCDETTKRSVQAASSEPLCMEEDCKERIYWMCHKCPTLPPLKRYNRKPLTRRGKPVLAPHKAMGKPARDMLNTGWRCGSSESGAAGTTDCGHLRCKKCLAFRVCRCPCRCQNMMQMPPTRFVCRPCWNDRCHSKSRKDKLAEALDIALSTLTDRLQSLMPGQNKTPQAVKAEETEKESTLPSVQPDNN